MTIRSELFTVVKKIFTVSEELTRLSGDLKEVSHVIQNHEVRLAVIETTLSIAQRSSSKLILPGN